VDSIYNLEPGDLAFLLTCCDMLGNFWETHFSHPSSRSIFLSTSKDDCDNTIPYYDTQIDIFESPFSSAKYYTKHLINNSKGHFYFGGCSLLIQNEFHKMNFGRSGTGISISVFC
jgi:hypothetical protein